MAQQTIIIGSASNDGTGESLRAGGAKINSNFSELYTRKQSAYEPAVVGDGIVDDSIAIQAAIDTAAAAGGGTVHLTTGTFRVASSIVIKPKVCLIGSGRLATVIKAANGLNAPVIKNYQSSDGTTDANAQFITIADLQVDGNKANQSAGSWYGIYLTVNPLTTQTTGDFDYDSHNLIQNVVIKNCKSHGIYVTGRSETRMNYVWADRNDGHGIYPSYDSFLSSCTASWSGGNGFQIEQSSIRLNLCKAFYNGQISMDGDTSGVGFQIKNSIVGGVTLSSCEAQDNNGPGFSLNGTRGALLVGCVADSNCSRGSGLTTAIGTYPGFDIWDSYDNHIVGCLSYERQAYTTSGQQNAIRIRSSSARNVISISHRAAQSATVGAAITSTSTAVAGNRITINNQDGCQQPAFAASFTPDPYLGSVQMTLTANVTIGAPSNAHIGCRLSFLLKQDSNGSRTISWNATYKFMGTWTATTTANGYSSITFEYNGTDWVETR